MRFFIIKTILLLSIIQSSFAYATSSIFCSSDTTDFGFEVQYGSTGSYAGAKVHTREHYYYVRNKWVALDWYTGTIYLIGLGGDRIVSATGERAENTALGDLVFIADYVKGVLSVGGVLHQLKCDWSA